MLFFATDRIYRTTEKLFQIVECKACRLIRLEPRPTNAELERYDPDACWPEFAATRLEHASCRFLLRDQVAFVREALSHSDGRGYVLDAGCRDGLLLSMVPWPRILGLDPSRRALTTAWRYNGVPGACAGLDAAPLPASSCSVVAMLHMLEYRRDPVACLKAAYDLLTPEGRLVIQAANASSWQFMMFGERWNGLDAPRALYCYRERDIENLLSFCGFEIVRRKHFSLENAAGLAATLLPGYDPRVRRRRGERNRIGGILKSAAFLGAMAAALPFTMVGAACGAGSTVLIEARKKPASR